MAATRASAPGGPASLTRAVGRAALVFFVVGDILGAGIYALTGRVAGQVGGAVWLPFLLAFGLAGLTAASYAELVGRFPQAAGAALYVNRAFGRPFVSFLVAFSVVVSGLTSAAAAARAFGGGYLAALTGIADVPAVAAALLFLLLVTLVNLWGIGQSVRVNIAFTLVEAAGLLVIVTIGAYALATGEGDPGRAMSLDTDGPALLAVLGGTALAFYALLGFEDSVNLAEESRDPRRDLPRALFTGLAVAGAVYLMVAFTSTMLVAPDVLASSSGPLLEVVEVAGLTFPTRLFAAIALVAVSNTALANMIMASRLVYGMAREGVIPAVLGRVGPRGVPRVAVLTTLAVAVALSATGDLARLAETTVLLLLCVFAAVNASVLALRRRDAVDGAGFGSGAGSGSRFRTSSWAAASGAVASLVLASPLTGRDPSVYLRAVVLLALGVALWFVNRRLVNRRPVERRPVERRPDGGRPDGRHPDEAEGTQPA